MAMKNKEEFIEVLNNLMWSWGSDTPPEAICVANELVEWVEKEFGITIDAEFEEDSDGQEEIFEELGQKL